jgi:hypothetical protein
MEHKKASLVTGPDGMRFIYEIDGSGQKYLARFPYTKKPVSVFPVKNQDIRDSLELLDVLKDGKVAPKGIRIMSEQFADELKTVKGPNDRIKLEVLGIVLNSKVTPLGLELLQRKMMDQMASVSNGKLAINECDKEESLLRVEY